MLKKTMTYVDYNGEERTEDFYFNLTKAEAIELELCEKGGMENTINEIAQTRDGKRLVELWKKVILMAYGKKSPDGRRFMKSPEISAEFAETEAFSDLFYTFATDGKAGAEFINAIMPKVDDKDIPLNK